MGKVGSTLEAAGVQITLNNVILDSAGQLAVTVLTVYNTSNATATYSTLTVDLAAERHDRPHLTSPTPTAARSSRRCSGLALFAPLSPNQSAQGCEYFAVPAGAVPAMLEILVKPTLRWQIAKTDAGAGIFSPTTTPGTSHHRRHRHRDRHGHRDRDRDRHRDWDRARAPAPGPGPGPDDHQTRDQPGPHTSPNPAPKHKKTKKATHHPPAEHHAHRPKKHG